MAWSVYYKVAITTTVWYGQKERKYTNEIKQRFQKIPEGKKHFTVISLAYKFLPTTQST